MLYIIGGIAGFFVVVFIAIISYCAWTIVRAMKNNKKTEKRIEELQHQLRTMPNNQQGEFAK